MDSQRVSVWECAECGAIYRNQKQAEECCPGFVVPDGVPGEVATENPELNKLEGITQ